MQEKYALKVPDGSNTALNLKQVVLGDPMQVPTNVVEQNGTDKTVKVRIWNWLSGKNPWNISTYSLLARKQYQLMHVYITKKDRESQPLSVYIYNRLVLEF